MKPINYAESNANMMDAYEKEVYLVAQLEKITGHGPSARAARKRLKQELKDHRRKHKLTVLSPNIKLVEVVAVVTAVAVVVGAFL